MMIQCECQNWANAGGDDAAQQMLTGHHPRCERGDFRKSALKLIADLAHALEAWGHEEDGIPDFAYEPYRQAKALQGVFFWKAVANERSNHRKNKGGET